MRLVIQRDYQSMSAWAAGYLAKKIMAAAHARRPFVLGLPTGSSPLGTYDALVELYQAGQLDFAHVQTFNMDEYVGLDGRHPQSYRSFMETHLFSRVNIPSGNIHMLDGCAKNLEAECHGYEESIRALGGIDLFLGGIGADGHIAFNEPGSSLHSRTRIKTLNEQTRQANSRFFDDRPDQVPRQALTVGVGTIMDAREVVILANGSAKARALQQVVEEGVNHMWTLSMLQMHPKAMICCCEDTVAELKVGTYRYFMDIEKDNLDPSNPR